MITVKDLGRVGRFANQMFQIAGVIGIATRKGYQYGFEKWMNYDHKERFGSTEDIDLQKYFVNPLPLLEDVTRFPQFNMPWGYHPEVPDNVSIFGHMQSERFFKHCIDTIRNYFRMVDEPEQNDYVAVHYRAGDYTEGLGTYHPRQSMGYYEVAMGFFPGAKFLVFSDDIEAAKLMFGTGEDIMYSRQKDYIMDFRLMKRCRSFITSNSSYPLMASILGEHPDKKIVCPRLWFGAIAGITGEDCYPEGAIVI